MVMGKPRGLRPLGDGRLHPTRFASNKLVSERQIALAALRLDVVKKHRLSEARALRKPDVARDDGSKDQARKMLFHFLRDLMSDVCSRIEHREQDSLGRQSRI